MHARYVFLADLLRQRRLSFDALGLSAENVVLLAGDLHFKRVHGLFDVGQFFGEVILGAGGGGPTLLPVLFAEGCARVWPDGPGLLQGGLEAIESRLCHCCGVGSGLSRARQAEAERAGEDRKKKKKKTCKQTIWDC